MWQNLPSELWREVVALFLEDLADIEACRHTCKTLNRSQPWLPAKLVRFSWDVPEQTLRKTAIEIATQHLLQLITHGYRGYILTHDRRLVNVPDLLRVIPDLESGPSSPPWAVPFTTPCVLDSSQLPQPQTIPLIQPTTLLHHDVASRNPVTEGLQEKRFYRLVTFVKLFWPEGRRFDPESLSEAQRADILERKLLATRAVRRRRDDDEVLIVSEARRRAIASRDHAAWGNGKVFFTILSLPRDYGHIATRWQPNKSETYQCHEPRLWCAEQQQCSKHHTPINNWCETHVHGVLRRKRNVKRKTRRKEEGCRPLKRIRHELAESSVNPRSESCFSPQSCPSESTPR